jgi:hypothetical protein
MQPAALLRGPDVWILHLFHGVPGAELVRKRGGALHVESS